MVPGISFHHQYIQGSAARNRPSNAIPNRGTTKTSISFSIEGSYYTKSALRE